MQSPAYKLFKENTLIITGGFIWNIKNKREDENYFRWYTRTFGITKGNKLSALEEDYLENHQDRIKQNTGEDYIRLTDFALKVIMRKKETSYNTSYAIEALLNRPLFICDGVIYRLEKTRNENHEIRINKETYSIDKKLIETEEFEYRFGRKLEEKIKRDYTGKRTEKFASQEEFYDARENLGFEKQTIDSLFTHL